MTNILDMEVVEELLSLTGDEDPELLLDLIGMFLDDAPDKLQKLEAAFETGDMQELARIAHSLKGSAGNLGVIMLQEDCDTLQVAGRQEVSDKVTQCMSSIRLHFDEAVGALSDLRNRYQP